jgi:hypothetical protein
MRDTFQNRLLRTIAFAFIPCAVAAFITLAHLDVVCATPPHLPIPSSPHRLSTPADPHLAQGGIISAVQSLFSYIINATVYFPARTFQDAVEKATRNIFAGQLDLIRGPLQEVLHVYAFTGAAVFGSVALPGEVKAIGQRLTQAAVPLWVLSLVLLGLAAMTRTIAGAGYGTNVLAIEVMRWFFIALASGNGVGIVNQTHNAFGALAYAIASSNGTVSPAEFVAAFIPNLAAARVMPLIILVIGSIVGVIVIVILAITYIARYALLMAITGLAPLAIACEGIPFTRFVFRDWLSMFLRMELIQIVNVMLLVLFKSLGLLAAAKGSSVTQAILMIAVMLGLASAVIAINTSVYKQVFGTAIAAGEQMMQVAGVLIGSAMASDKLPSLRSVGAGAASSQGTSAAPSTEQSNSTSSLARPLGNTRMPMLSNFMRGYADGATAQRDGSQRQAGAARMADQQHERDMSRGRALAREMGATNPDDIDAIANSIVQPPSGKTSEQMMRAHRDNADLTRRMAQTQGGPARAAAVSGQGQFSSFGDMAIAMANERLNANSNSNTNTNSESAGSFAEQMRAAPVHTWQSTPPQLTDPGGQTMHAFDFGIGATLAREVGAHPSHAPLWANQAHGLRMAYGENFVQGLAQRAQHEHMTEAQLMHAVDQHIETEPAPRPVKRFWLAGPARGEQHE